MLKIDNKWGSFILWEMVPYYKWVHVATTDGKIWLKVVIPRADSNSFKSRGLAPVADCGVFLYYVQLLANINSSYFISPAVILCSKRCLLYVRPLGCERIVLLGRSTDYSFIWEYQLHVQQRLSEDVCISDVTALLCIPLSSWAPCVWSLVQQNVLGFRAVPQSCLYSAASLCTRYVWSMGHIVLLNPLARRDGCGVKKGLLSHLYGRH